ncbi:17-beta-hydroxysteroid dehydrogenase type 2-like [Carcharodon carcharias]|uniref:17-beta-hydroxysteroid dehydrogenase type 2-like n=1 Tax=Carcharodon carcharias TaxID=13397 RepID=UPI001B7EE687|nr:17-beta-hydroxysteroid dehydrogenase type 2-like [Carcharodon carcharias]
MDQPSDQQHNEVLFFSLLYSMATVMFGGAVARQLLKHELQMGARSAFILLLLFIGESVCFVALPGYSGLSLFAVACLLSYCTLPSTGLLPVQEKAILITGCDSGFGHALAKYLDKMGFIVYAGVLHLDGPGSQDLKADGSNRLTVLQLDVTSSEQIAKTFAKMKAELKNKGLWGVVNNAGILEFVADAELLPMNIYKRCMEVNFFGAVELTKMFLPLLRQAKGRLVNITSIAGSTPLPWFAAYGASKAALSMFSSVLRQELAIWGVKVAIIQPGGFKTGIFGTTDHWSNQHKQIVQQLSPDVKTDYGENYIISFKEKYAKWQATLQEDLQPVLNDISIALIAKNPKPLYTPGKAAFLLPVIMNYLPTCLSDFFIYQFFASGQGNVPDGVKETGS